MSAARHFVLTGCAGGIGRHLADVLLAQGHRVFATDVDLEALEAHAVAARWPTDRSRTRRLNVVAPDAWEHVMEEAIAAFGPLDVVMNIAGFLRPAWVHEATAEDVDRHLDVNAKGVIFGTRAAARRMVAQRRGHIINIASMAALAPIPGIALYSASKYAVRGFSLAAAQELRPHGVYVTVVCPDAVQTPMLDAQLAHDEAAATFSGPRLLTVEDVSRAIISQVLTRRPLELYLPPSRGWLARFADLFPGVAFLIGPLVRRKGLARQLNLRGSRGSK